MKQALIYSLSEYIVKTGQLSPEFALLGFLYEKPDHGYDLHQKFLRELGHVWHLSQSQAYAILKRLEQRGFISAQMVEQDKLPPKQIWSITPIGRRQFRTWLQTPSKSKARVIRMEFLTRLYFARQYKPEKLQDIYASQQAAIKSNVARLKKLIENLPADQEFNRLSLTLRVRQLQLILQWMAEIRNQLHIPSEVP